MQRWEWFTQIKHLQPLIHHYHQHDHSLHCRDHNHRHTVTSEAARTLAHSRYSNCFIYLAVEALFIILNKKHKHHVIEKLIVIEFVLYIFHHNLLKEESTRQMIIRYNTMHHTYRTSKLYSYMSCSQYPVFRWLNSLFSVHLQYVNN